MMEDQNIAITILIVRYSSCSDTATTLFRSRPSYRTANEIESNQENFAVNGQQRKLLLQTANKNTTSIRYKTVLFRFVLFLLSSPSTLSISLLLFSNFRLDEMQQIDAHVCCNCNSWQRQYQAPEKRWKWREGDARKIDGSNASS